MGEFFSGSALFAILLTFGAYELGRLFQQKTGVALFNPILVAAVLTGGGPGCGRRAQPGVPAAL